MLSSLIENNDLIKKNSKVFFFKNKGDTYYKLVKLGISAEQLPLNCVRSIFHSLFRIFYLLLNNRSSILHLWMYHPCVIIGIIAKLLSCTKIIWSLHHANFDTKYNKKFTLLFIYASSYLSHLVPNIIHSCSKYGIKEHLRIGYNNKFIYIPNGVDTRKFKPSVYKSFSSYFPQIQDPFVIGFFARWDSLKNHDGLLKQFTLALKNKPNLCLLLCGSNIDSNNNNLSELIAINKVPRTNIVLLGKQKNINAMYHEIDLFCLPSHGEAFPVVLCESLSCSVPCISTDVGDCSLILDSIGRCVAIQDFCKEFLYYSSISREYLYEIGQHCRKSILDNYDIQKISCHYVKLYKQL